MKPAMVVFNACGYCVGGWGSKFKDTKQQNPFKGLKSYFIPVKPNDCVNTLFKASAFFAYMFFLTISSEFI